MLLLARVDKLQVIDLSLGDLLPIGLAAAILPCRQGRTRDRVELELVVELTRSRELLCGFGASSFPSSRSFEFEFDEAAGLRDPVFTEFLWKRLKSWFEFEKRHFPSTGRGPKGSPF